MEQQGGGSHRHVVARASTATPAARPKERKVVRPTTKIDSNALRELIATVPVSAAAPANKRLAHTLPRGPAASIPEPMPAQAVELAEGTAKMEVVSLIAEPVAIAAPAPIEPEVTAAPVITAPPIRFSPFMIVAAAAAFTIAVAAAFAHFA